MGKKTSIVDDGETKISIEMRDFDGSLLIDVHQELQDLGNSSVTLSEDVFFKILLCVLYQKYK